MTTEQSFICTCTDAQYDTVRIFQLNYMICLERKKNWTAVVQTMVFDRLRESSVWVQWTSQNSQYRRFYPAHYFQVLTCVFWGVIGFSRGTENCSGWLFGLCPDYRDNERLENRRTQVPSGAESNLEEKSVVCAGRLCVNCLPWHPG